MCGIAGWVSRERVDPEALARPLAALARRGPDGCRTWQAPGGQAILGHRRLAILDTSPRGEEPSVGPGGRSGFVHNGEIYNFKTLRSELTTRGETFLSESDGEVVHRLLLRDGPAALEKLEGMFALALWMETETAGTLLLARDRIGIKPLYYAVLPNGLAFASQPKALLTLPNLAARLDPDALSDYLSYGYVPFDRSIFAGVRKLPAAHCLVYEPAAGRLEVRPYWRLERDPGSDDAGQLREKIERAVRSHMISDVPVGAFLSGGLDSSTVVAVAARQAERPFPTFAVAYRDGSLSDIEHARLAAKAFGTAHREELLDVGDLPSALERAAQIYDEPLYDSRALAMVELSRMARSQVTVALSGDGGDEVFGGYGWHQTALHYEDMRRRLEGLRPALALADRALRGPASRIPRLSRAAGAARLLAPDFPDRYFPVRGFFHRSEQERVLGRSPEDPAWLIRRFDRPDLPLVHRLLYLDLHTYLPDNGLVIVDRSTMALGLEARVPLLDRQLVEYAFALPPERLLKPGATKVAFREAVSPWLPESIVKRPKAGFSPPFKRWVGGAGREKALRSLERGRLASDGVIDPRGARALIEGGTQRRHGKLWLLLCLEAWYSRWIVAERSGALMAGS
ncbi:MAG: asparagine synthase (glutamine-hydrolyzing) [Thermoanaerobaculia bacterium]